MSKWMGSLIFPGAVILAVAVGAAAAWLSRPIYPVCASTVEFAPQPDITPLELAIIVSHAKGFAYGRVICVDAGHPIPPELLRHFKTR